MAPASLRRTPTAFTLVELLTVMVVISILFATTAGLVHGVRERANVARARSELAALATALEDFRRRHGDYPQLGAFPQAPAAPDRVSSGPGLDTVQAKLFNCLSGVFGASLFEPGDRLDGADLLGAGGFSLDGRHADPSRAALGVPSQKPEQDVALLDPWGRRYFYYYKDANKATRWQAPGYILYSAGRTVGADGNERPPLDPATGLMLPVASPEVADNIYANPGIP